YDVPGRFSQKVYERYQQALQAAGAVDFGDLIVRVIELFRKQPEIAQAYSSRFRYILVDEFQDTNPAQYQLLRILAEEHGNLGVVGDDDQSIYRWRGAEVDNILDFPRHFPGTKVVKLEQNYRSTGRILAAAHAVIEKNPRRAEKKLWTAAGEGDKLRVVLAEDERDEAQRVAQELYAENARGTSYSEMAVFYRANAQSRALEDGLRARRVPYRVVWGRSLYDRAHEGGAVPRSGRPAGRRGPGRARRGRRDRAGDERDRIRRSAPAGGRRRRRQAGKPLRARRGGPRVRCRLGRRANRAGERRLRCVLVGRVGACRSCRGRAPARTGCPGEPRRGRRAGRPSRSGRGARRRLSRAGRRRGGHAAPRP